MPVVDIFKSVRTSFFIRTSFFLSFVQIIQVNNYSFSYISFLVFVKIRQMWRKFVDFIRISFSISITIIAIVRRKIINLTNVSFLSSTDDAQTFRKRQWQVIRGTEWPLIPKSFHFLYFIYYNRNLIELQYLTMRRIEISLNTITSKLIKNINYVKET